MNFTDLCDQHGMDYRVERPGWVNTQCPLCHKRPYLGYNLRGRYANCWSCGRVPMVQVLYFITGLPEAECYRLLGELPRTAEPWEKKVAKGTLVRPQGLGELGTLHKQYLRERRFDPDTTVRRYGISAIGILGGMLKWRIYIPVFYKGEEVSWTTRAIGSMLPKYYSASDDQSAIPIDHLIYGIDECQKVIILVEGPVDVWRIGSGAAALLGQRTSPAQLEQLSRFPVRVVCFDSEPGAQERARKLANDMSVFDGVTHRVELESKDPGEATHEEIKELRREFGL
jgi:hypothetical protein